MLLAQIFVYGLYAYLAFGLLFGLWFVFLRAHRIDEGMEGASWRLRLLLLPGSALLWPALIGKPTIKKPEGD